MVMQRGMSVPVFGGGGSAGMVLELEFRGESHQTVVEQDGSWEVQLPEQSPGGPFEMVIRQADDVVVVNTVYVGDVWIASGQSNMDMAMRMAWPLYEDVIETASIPEVRHFWVPKRADFHEPQKDLAGGSWVPVSPGNNPRLSAVAFFFSKHIHQTQEVPVGIITASLGGSPAEAWMSGESLTGWPVHYEEAIQFRNQALIDSIVHYDQSRKAAWYAQLNKEDLGYQGELPWNHPDIDHTDWPIMNVPGTWSEAIAKENSQNVEQLNGVVWVRRDLHLDEAPEPGEYVLLTLGAIVTADSVFVNGVYVGNTTYRHPPRWYSIPDGVLNEGRNTIAIRIFNELGLGGFVLEKPYNLAIGRGDEARIYDLEGLWHYRVGATSGQLAPPTHIIRKPTGVFNAMIAPLTRYPISGTIWYQGESNSSRFEEYRTLFPALIQGWRDTWDQGDFPFLFVQLANYMAVSNNPSASSNWASMREAQFMTTQAVPNSAMASAIDIGEATDIHPLNKKDVGDRLALAARKLHYGEEVVATGPVFNSATVDGSRMIVTFDGVHGGLHIGRPNVDSTENHLGGFAVAGSDGVFHWAQSKIVNDTVLVWSTEVANPKAVRYAWANNPIDANLYNVAGLPAVPFHYTVNN